MNFADKTPDQKGQIVARAWAAIGVPADSITDEMMAEWIDGLHDLTMDDIKRGVDTCKSKGATAPIEVFVRYCKPVSERAIGDIIKPRSGDSEMARREKARIAAILRGEDVESKAESWRKLHLDRIRGPLPETMK